MDEQLTSRQKEILIRTIESHIATFLPVGSRTLTERYRMSLSPASVRHEMGVLEELGFLGHPHTSAGRVPTDKGYRFYADHAIPEGPLTEELLNVISKAMEGRAKGLESLLEHASQVLAAIAEEAVVMVSPVLQKICLKEITLVPLTGTRLLAVWCSTSGLVQDSLVEMREALSLEEAERIRNFINQELSGVSVEELETELLKRIRVRQDSLRRLYRRALEVVRESVPPWCRPRLFVEGTRYVLNQPEFQDLEKFRLFMDTVEEKSNLIRLLNEHPQGPDFHVAIGGKELSDRIWDCALVSSPYQYRGASVGRVAVLGPRRMPYGRIIGLVRQMAREVSRALERSES